MSKLNVVYQTEPNEVHNYMENRKTQELKLKRCTWSFNAVKTTRIACPKKIKSRHCSW